MVTLGKKGVEIFLLIVLIMPAIIFINIAMAIVAKISCLRSRGMFWWLDILI